jgi:hypothetical protein
MNRYAHIMSWSCRMRAADRRVPAVPLSGKD